MLIRCPDCEFEREIDPAAIASTAVRATCPRCKTKFYFRNPDGSFVEFEAAPASSESASPRVAASQTEGEPTLVSPVLGGEVDDDPPPPGAVVPDMPRLPGVEPARAEKAVSREAGEAAAKVAAKAPVAPRVPGERQAMDTEKRGFLAIFEKKLKEAKEQLAGRKERQPEADDEGAPGADDAGPKDAGASRAKALAFLPADDDVPWEMPWKYGVVMGLYQTILRVLFGAPRFFASLPQSSTPWFRPVAFYVVLGMFQTVMERTWYLMSFQAMGPSIADPKVQELLGAMAHEMSLPMTLLLAPATLFMQLGFYTALFFMMVRLVQPENASFQLILRVIAYSAAPAVVCVVPLVGTLANAVWFAVCCCVGCKYALNMAWSRVLLALGPLYLVAFAVLGQFMRQLMG